MTGTWFMEGVDFAKWKNELNLFLWLHGIRTFFNGNFELHQVLMDNNSGVWQNNFVVSYFDCRGSSTT
jgi:hypothetical protein